MTAPRVVVDAGSGVPPWRQVHDQLVRLIEFGTLAPGHRLPAIRRLARDLGLASGTVARVYRELESGGLVTTEGARGTVVTGPGAGADAASLLRDAAGKFTAFARELGADEDTAVAAVRESWRSR